MSASLSERTGFFCEAFFSNGVFGILAHCIPIFPLVGLQFSLLKIIRSNEPIFYSVIEESLIRYCCVNTFHIYAHVYLSYVNIPDKMKRKTKSYHMHACSESFCELGRGNLED